MLASYVVAALLAAAPVKLASTPWTTVNVAPEEASFFHEHFAQRLAQSGITVVTPSEISAIIGLERQRQLLGCSTDESNCIAELAGALGVDGLVIGNIARFERGYAVDIRIVSAATGDKLAVQSGSPGSSADDVLAWLKVAAPTMAELVWSKLRPNEPPLVMSGAGHSPATSPRVLVPAALGVAAAGVGTFGWLSATAERDAIRRGDDFNAEELDASRQLLDQRVQRGQTMQVLALCGWGVGAAALALAGVMWATGDADASASALFTADTALVAVGARF